MIENFYKPGIVIERVTNTNDGGVISEAWATHLIINGHIRSLAVSERVFTDKETVFADHKLYCAEHDIIEADRVNDGGVYYEIKGVQNKLDSSSVIKHMEIDLLKKVIERT